MQGCNFTTQVSKKFKIQTNLSTGESMIDQTIKIYPNPSKGIFQISVGDLKNGQLEYEIYSTPGSLIQKRKLSKPLNTIDWSEKPTGVFILKIISNNGLQPIIFKLIKQYFLFIYLT